MSIINYKKNELKNVENWEHFESWCDAESEASGTSVQWVDRTELLTKCYNENLDHFNKNAYNLIETIKKYNIHNFSAYILSDVLNLTPATIRELITRIREFPELFLQPGEMIVSFTKGYTLTSDRKTIEKYFDKLNSYYTSKQMQHLKLLQILNKHKPAKSLEAHIKEMES